MGSFYKKTDKPNDWVFQYMENGKKKYKVFSDLGKLSKEQRKKYKRKFEVQYEDVKVRNDEGRKEVKFSLSKVIEFHNEERQKKVKRNLLSQNTVNSDKRKLSYFRDYVRSSYGNIGIEKIDDEVLNGYTDYLERSLNGGKGGSPTTIGNYHKSIQPLMKHSLIKGWIKSNPYESKLIELPKPISRSKDDIPTKEESKILKDYLINYVDDYMKDKEPFDLIRLTSFFQITLGCRIGEILMMKWSKGKSDVGEKHSFSYVYLNSTLKILVIHFKRKRRELPLKDIHSNLLRKIKSDLGSKVYVFENRTMTKKDGKRKGRRHKQSTNTKYENTYCSRPFKRLLDSLGIDNKYTTHCLRHSFVTDLMRKDVSLTKIGLVVGHSSQRITELYGHLDTTDMVDVLDLV